MIVTQPRHENVSLRAGEQLTVIADANSSGIVYRRGAAQRSVAAGATEIFGPYAETQYFDVVPSAGFLTYSSQNADPLRVPKLGTFSQTVGFAEFTDGLSASGTFILTGQIPAGAIFLHSKVKVPAGFAGNVSAVLTIGDGSDPDRYNTGTPSVFATAADGIQMGIPSGSKYHTAAQAVTLTIAGGTDFTAINAGSLVVSLYYLETE